MYDCQRCLASHEKVDVRARREREDLMTWINIAMKVMGTEHRRRSPQCPARQLDAYFPTAKLPDGQIAVGVRGAELTDEDKAELKRLLNKTNAERAMRDVV